MDNIKNYADNIFVNSKKTIKKRESKLSVLKGGDKNNKNIPTGGFPPIFECKEKEVKDIKLDTFISPIKKKKVSISELLKKRSVTPFI